MAVVPGGFFGQYYVDYEMMRDARNWNTKNYDYAVVKNKGEIGENAKNETDGADEGTGLFVTANKHGYYDANGAFIKSIENPIYQIRDRNGKVNNDYYVDQETGNVFFRPAITPASPTTTTNIINNALYDYDNGTPTPNQFFVNLAAASASSATQIYNWGAIPVGYTIDMIAEFSSDNGSTWQAIPDPNGTRTLSFGSAPSGTMTYDVPTNSDLIRLRAVVTPPPATTSTSTFNHTYNMSPVVSPTTNSNASAGFNLADAASATVEMDYNWTMLAGANATPTVEYSTNGTTWIPIPSSQVSLNASSTASVTANVPAGAFAASTMFRVSSAITGAPGTVTTLPTHNYTMPALVNGSNNISTNPVTFDLSGATSANLVMNYNWTVQQGSLTEPQIEYSVNGTNWFSIPASAVTLATSSTSLALAANAGDSSIEVNTAGGIVPGSIIFVNGQQLTVGSVVGNTVNFAPPLAASAAVNATVTANSVGSTAAIDISGLVPSPLTAATMFRLQADVTQGPFVPATPIVLSSVNPYTTGAAYPTAANLDLTGAPVSVVSSFAMNITAGNTPIFGRQEYFNGAAWVPLGGTDVNIGGPPAYTVGAGFTPDLTGNPINSQFDYTISGGGVLGNTAMASTTTTAVALIGDIQLTVADATNYAIGDTVNVNGQTLLIDNVVGNDIFFTTTPLLGPVGIGDAVTEVYPAGANSIVVANAAAAGIVAGSTLDIGGQIITVASVVGDTINLDPPGLAAPTTPATNIQRVNPALFIRQEYSTDNGVTWIPTGGPGGTANIAVNSTASATLTSRNETPHPLTQNAVPATQVRVQAYTDAGFTIPAAADNYTAGTRTGTKHLLGGSEEHITANFGPTTVNSSITIPNPDTFGFFGTPAQKIRFQTYSDAFFTVPSNAGYNPGNSSIIKNPSGGTNAMPFFNSTSIDVTKTAPAQLPVFTSSANNLQVVKTVNVPPPTAPAFLSGNLTVNRTIGGNGAGIVLPPGSLPGVNAANVTTDAELARRTPQYFGTSFVLADVPNPEDFGINQANNLNYSTLIGGLPSLAFSQIEVNGVVIAANGLDTSVLSAIPSTPDDALFTHANSFTAGAEDFTPVLPVTLWTGAQAVLSKPPFGGTGGGIGTAIGGSGPAMTNDDAMWLNDQTDTHFNPAGASNIGVFDVLMRKKIELASVPAGPINIDFGVADFGELYVNGTRVPGTPVSWPNSTTINIQPFLKVGTNIIGIHARDTDLDEGVYLKMSSPTDTGRLGTDIGAKEGGWEAVAGPFGGAIGPVSDATFNDAWNYNAADGTYNNGGIGGFKKSYFNGRTADNFVISADIRLDKSSGSTADWGGIHIRGTKPGDSFSQSGYLVYWRQNGSIELFKAGEASPVVATGAAAGLGVGVKHNLEIHANGNNIKVYADGNLTPVIDYIDQDRAFTDGYASFMTLGHGMSFDNFQMQSYSAPIQLLSRALKKGENSVVIKGYDTKHGTVVVDGTGNKGTIGGINLSTGNVPPNLGVTDIMHRFYRGEQEKGTIDVDPGTAGIQLGELEDDKGYWSVSTNSALGIAGKIQFQNREGGSLHKTRDQFSNVNSLMQGLTSILGANDDLFNSHLNLIR